MSELSCNLNNQETIPFSTLAAEVSISLPAVSETIINAAIFRASTDFLSKSQVLREIIYLDYQQYVIDYPIDTLNCYTVNVIENVWVDGCKLGNREWGTNSDGWLELAKHWANKCDGTELKVEVVMSLSKNTCELPKVIYERYGEGIIYMTLSRLYGMHGEEWYDPNLIRFYGGIGRQSIADAKSLLQQENSNGEIDIKPSEMIL